ASTTYPLNLALLSNSFRSPIREDQTEIHKRTLFFTFFLSLLKPFQRSQRLALCSQIVSSTLYAVVKEHCSLQKTSLSSQTGMVGRTGLEPVTPALSRRCSNQLSYMPFWSR